MRAILIDPEKRTFTEIQLANGDYKEIQKVLSCRSFTIGAFLSGSYETGFDAVDVSDDELEDRDDPHFWFQVDAQRNPPSSYPIAELGLATGTDPEGASCDVSISVAELQSRITFTQRKFRGFVTHTGAAAHARGAHIVVEPMAPIIDGTDEINR
jgi:hypothetical protein